jgi:hypothetical protein
MRKNNRSVKCFGVFLQTRAFADIESRFAAARVVFHQRRRADAAATLARIQGEISPTEVARPMSRRQIWERRELFLPPPWPDWRIDSRHWATVFLGLIFQPEVCGLAAPVSCGLREAPRCWPRKRVNKRTVTPPGQMPDPPRAEILDAHRLFASLILRRVRAQGSSAGDCERPDCCSDHRKVIPGSAVAEEDRWRPRRDPPRPVTETAADSRESPVETQLAELAWRHLHGRAAGERP